MMTIRHYALVLAAICLLNVVVTRTHAACAVDDADFNTAGGGCEDAETGLVWSSDVLAPLGRLGTGIYFTSVSPTCDQFAHGSDTDGDGVPDVVYLEAEGFTDWRAPTVREVLTALDNGLAGHLDYSYDAGIQSVDGLPRWTQCVASLESISKSAKKKNGGFLVYHTDGSLLLDQGVPFTQELLCVRGAAADVANDCPDSYGVFPEDQNTKPGKGKNSMLLPRSLMGSLLILPALVVGGVGFLRRRG
jgi:hypothetical protein